MKRYAMLVSLLFLLLAGCGYRVPDAGDAWIGQQGRTFYVKLFANRTAEPYLDSVVTEEVAMQLSRSRLAELVEDQKSADLLLGGTVTNFASDAVAYDANDNISEYRARMTVKARLVRREDGAVLWEEEFSRRETYPALANKSQQQEGESLAARILARRIAEDLYARLLTAF